MDITIKQNEIEEAIREWLTGRGIVFNEGVVPKITLSAGRGANGYTAAIDMDGETFVEMGPGTIEVIPGTEKDLSKFVKPAAKAATAFKKPTPKLAAELVAELEEEEPSEVVEEEAPFEEEVVEEVVETAPVKKGLFGKKAAAIQPEAIVEEEEVAVEGDAMFAGQEPVEELVEEEEPVAAAPAKKSLFKKK